MAVRWAPTSGARAMIARKPLAAVAPEQSTIVCDIRFLPDREHEARCLLAWKRREHPAWSQHAVSYRVVERNRLKAVAS
jgi:hypothetical protein